MTINDRVDIFANPNARRLHVTNLGVLDQRLAVKWVFGNIVNFGEDPTRITMWDSLLAPF